MSSLLRLARSSGLAFVTALALGAHAAPALAAGDPATAEAAAPAPELPPFGPGYRRLPTVPRLRYFVGASLGAEHALGGYWGAGFAGSLGAQITEVVGLDFEAHASIAYIALGARASVLVDFTVRPWLSLAVGPTVFAGVDYLMLVSRHVGAAYVGTVRATFRPWPRIDPGGRRSGLALAAWLDAGYSEARTNGELCAEYCQTFAIGGFVGVGYQGF